MSTEEVKTCAKCGETKQAGQFRTRRATCKPCQAEYDRQYYAENRDKIAEYLSQYRAALPDACVAQEIKRGTALTRADIPPELLEAKRLQLKLKRLAREAMK